MEVTDQISYPIWTTFNENIDTKLSSYHPKKYGYVGQDTKQDNFHELTRIGD